MSFPDVPKKSESRPEAASTREWRCETCLGSVSHLATVKKRFCFECSKRRHALYRKNRIERAVRNVVIMYGLKLDIEAFLKSIVIELENPKEWK